MYHIFEIRLFFLINFKKIYHYRTHRSLKSVKQYGLTHFVSGWFLVFFCFFFNSFLLLQDMEKNIFKTLTATLSSSYLHPLPHLTSTLSPSHRHPLLILPPPIWWWSVPFTLHAEHFPIQGRGSFLIQKQFLKRFVEIFCSLWDLYWEDMVPKHIPPHTTFTYRKWLMSFKVCADVQILILLQYEDNFRYLQSTTCPCGHLYLAVTGIKRPHFSSPVIQ
jgi:hypothetical protein